MQRKILITLCFFVSCGMMTATYSYLGTFQSSTQNTQEVPQTKSNAKGVFIPPKYPNQTTTTTTTTTTSTSNVQLSKYYVNKRYNFSIQYPANWQYVQPTSSMASFIGTYGTPSSQSSLTIQSIKGRGLSAQQMIERAKQTLVRRAGSFVIDDDNATPALPNSPGYQGRYVIFRYTIDNTPMQQIEILFYKNPNRVLFVVDYIAPESQFATDLPVAKAMIKSITLP